MSETNHSPSPNGNGAKPAPLLTTGDVPTEHGLVQLESAPSSKSLKQHAPERKATGLPAVLNSFYYGIAEAGPFRGTLPMLQINQDNGFDCPGCAWPDPDGKRSPFDFCENGAKAIAHESDRRRITPDFFATHSVAALSNESDYWLEQQGRLTEPVILREGATHYEPISWEDALGEIAAELNGLASPDEASFYTSGKAVNEAAFAYQLFVRQFGTNNLPDCSNMCHESSGSALTNVIGFGKGTVKLEDFEHAELVLVCGQNPGTNHPRQLTALQKSKRNGAKIVAVNPLPEAGLVAFMNPQEPLGLLGIATKLADEFLQVRVNGDVALFKGIMKHLVECDDRQRGSAIDWDYVNTYTTGIDELLTSLRRASWEEIVEVSGIARERITAVAEDVRKARKIIICWCLGITQHHNGTHNVQELINVLLLRGAMGKQGAGACCVRGHSNVQGDRTMGVWERVSDGFLDSLQGAFEFNPPRKHGLDAQKTILAMHDGRVKVLVSLGGNFLLALPDSRFAAEAMRKASLTVRIGTKLNRADLVTGTRAILLPCLGRTEADVRRDGSGRVVKEQFTSTENSMGVVQWSRGRFSPASEQLLGETEIVCRLAAATLGPRTKTPWLAWANDYDLIREGIARVIPGCEGYNEKVRRPGGFYLPNPPRENQFPTPTGKALLTVNPIPHHDLKPGQLAMTTVRSHDQFNTTIYGLHDRYRGLHHERRVVMMNADDLRALGLKPHQKVDVTSHYEGQTRMLREYLAVEYPIPRRCAAMYYPEANVLVPIGSTDPISNCPTFKHTVISVTPAAE